MRECYSKLTHMIAYLLTNTVNGKQYVGQTRQPVRLRWRQHRKDSRRRNTALANALRKYGHMMFTVKVLSVALNSSVLTTLEQFWIKELGTLVPGGYNLTEGGEGGQRSLETRAKMSVIAVRNSADTRARMLGNRHNVGRKQSREHVENKGLALLGNKNGLGNRSRTGQTNRADTNAKISKSLLGNSYAKGYKHSEETRTKVRLAGQGKKQSVVTIAKRVATRKRNRLLREAEATNV